MKSLTRAKPLVGGSFFVFMSNQYQNCSSQKLKVQQWQLTFLHVDPSVAVIGKGFCKSFAPQNNMEHGAKTSSNGTDKTSSATSRRRCFYPGDGPAGRYQSQQRS